MAQTPARKVAERDVMVTVSPLLKDLTRGAAAAQKDYQFDSAQVDGIFNGLMTELAPLAGNYNTQIAGTQGNLLQTLSNWMPSFGMGGAAQGLYGSITGGGMNLLANAQSRNIAYDTSSKRQAGIDRANTKTSLLHDLTKTLDEMRGKRRDIMADVPTLIRQRLDEVRAGRFDQSIALKEYALRRSALKAQLGALNTGLGLLGGK